MKNQMMTADATRLDIRRLIEDGKTLVEQARTVVADAGVQLLLPQHEYVQGPRVGASWRVLGVTEVLRTVGIIDDRWWTEQHATRGTVVHECTAISNWARPVQWGPASEGYGASLQAWREQTRLITLATELLVYHPLYDYAGTLDWFGVLHDTYWVLDWKTGVEARWHGVQSAAYVSALLASGDRARVRRGAIYLHEDGMPATLRAHYKLSDARVFQAALAVARFRKGR